MGWMENENEEEHGREVGWTYCGLAGRRALIKSHEAIFGALTKRRLQM